MRNKVSKTVGRIMLWASPLPFMVWLIHQLGWLLPAEGHDDSEWAFILMTMAMIGLGTLLVKNKGEAISTAILSWFNRKSGGSNN